MAQRGKGPQVFFGVLWAFDDPCSLRSDLKKLETFDPVFDEIW
jgi:hypothetical protein